VSRIGKLPVAIPDGVKCELDGQHLKVTGPKGSLDIELSPRVSLTIEDDVLTVARTAEQKQDRAQHGLTRALIYNMVEGVTEGYSRELMIEGTGYRANMQGKSLNLQVGYSHPVVVDPPDGVEFAVDGTQKVKVTGIDKQAVGQIAAKIRAKRPVEPYRGKGIRYADEYVRRKAGKTGK